ncbi:hypothetical protein D3C72_1321430 [compost metagenome]
MHQQGIGRDQQDLEEDEQVEQVSGEEGAVDPQQLELEQGVETHAVAIVAAHRVEHRGAGQHGGGQQHQRGQPIQQQHDTEGRLPASQGVDAQLAIAGLLHQQQRERHQGQGGQHRDAALEAFHGGQHQQQRPGEQRNQDGQDRQVRHGADSCSGRPST